MGKLAELGTQSREGYLRNPERLSQNLKDIGRKAEPWKRLATEGFGQIMFGDEGTIPWYMSLAPGADLTDKLMEGRQPGLLDIPGPGTLGKFAMLPIAKFGAKGILEGTARMGKSARNLEKAKNPVFKMYHRTNVENIPSIMKNGLLASPPDKGVHTFMEENLPNMVWLSRTPEAPVLTDKARKYPRTVGHVEVTMPKSEYQNRRQFIDNRWRNLPDEDRDFVPIPRGGKFGAVSIFPEDISPNHLRDVTKEYWQKLEYPLKLDRLADNAGVDRMGSPLEIEDRLRSQTTKVRHDAIKSRNVKSWKPGELPVPMKNRYLGTVYTSYSPSVQKKKGAIYDKFYGTDQETHADLMRKLYYEASPKDRRDIIGYLEKDYENDWIDDNDWFDYVSDIRPEYRKFLRRLENNEEYQNYLNSMTFTE